MVSAKLILYEPEFIAVQPLHYCIHISPHRTDCHRVGFFFLLTSVNRVG